MCFKTHFKTWYASLVFLVQSQNVIPIFASTEPQEINYDIGVHNKTRHWALRHILGPDMYLWCLWSNLGMWYHFLHLQNLRNSIMTLLIIIEICLLVRTYGVKLVLLLVQILNKSTTALFIDNNRNMSSSKNLWG